MCIIPTLIIMDGLDNNVMNVDGDDDNRADGGGGDDGVLGDYLMASFAEKAFSGAVFERKTAAQELLEAFREICITGEDVTTLMTVIERLVCDTEHSIRATVMEQLPQIALFCHEEGTHLDHILPEYILPHIVKLLTDKFTQVRKTSQAGLLLLVERGIIIPSQVEDFVFPVIMEFTVPAAHEDYRTEITQFMSKLAPLIGKDIVVNSYLDRFCHLCHDKLFQIRRVCASSIGEIASVVGPTLTELVLVDHFRSLCKDDVWGVRKGCAETITVFSNCCRPNIRKGILTELFVDLLDDGSRWVRIAACQSLGPFITTFLVEESPPSTPEQSEVESTFLSGYKTFDFLPLPDSDSNNDSDDNDKSPSHTTAVIPSLVASPNNDSTSFIKKLKSICKGMVDQNQNKELFTATSTTEKTSTEFTVIPMDIDDDVELQDEVVRHPDSSMSFEERRIELAFSTTPDVNCNERGDAEPIISLCSLETLKEDTQLAKHNQQQQLSESTSSDNGNQQTLPEELASDGGLNYMPVILMEQQQSSIADEIEYTTWQYWRDPIPEVDLDVDMSDVFSPPTGSLVFKCQKTSEVNNELSWASDSSVEIKSNLPPIPRNPSDVHRSYMNLFNATTREHVFEDNGFESLKLHDNFGDDDDDDQLNVAFPYEDEYSQVLWGGRNCRPRLLAELPKAYPGSQDIVPGILLENFTSLCRPQKEDHSMDSEILSYCVYNLPAVVLTLGPQNWSLVRDCYEALACNMQWKIRYTLASSLHEIANILGPELSERDLVPFYNAITKDLDEVRIGILRNLSSFIKVLGGEAQRKCLETLDRFAITENSRNWRFRLELADQIKKLSEIYGAEEIFKHLCPLSMDLLLDRVSEVRKRALSVIPYIVTRLNYSYPDGSDDPHIVHDFLQHLIKTLGHSDVWVRRQAFAALAGQLIEIGAMSPPQFSHDILPILITLSKDKVPNVRLKVAQSIVLNILNQEYFSDPSNPEREILIKTLQQLQEDEDRDVRHCSQLPELSETETI